MTKDINNGSDYELSKHEGEDFNDDDGSRLKQSSNESGELSDEFTDTAVVTDCVGDPRKEIHVIKDINIGYDYKQSQNEEEGSQSNASMSEPSMEEQPNLRYFIKKVQIAVRKSGVANLRKIITYALNERKHTHVNIAMQRLERKKPEQQ
ncbi:uncharacterized protein LOC127850893 [Dreissena polymorpha]|uniref:uncharacterized protein LOC127850893 n=1 Tax=Dreissena polymorpha TaxID=45954 RepID=UPI0022650D6E|nr:uncharacterized protein LOC127850893 [Dreissena polymorpha]